MAVLGRFHCSVLDSKLSRFVRWNMRTMNSSEQELIAEMNKNITVSNKVQQ